MIASLRSGWDGRRRGWPMPRGRTAMVVLALCACLAAPGLVALDAPPWARLPAVLTLLCVGPGTALLGALTPLQRSLDPGLVIVSSLALSTLAAQTMLWLRAWSPDASLFLVATASLAAIVAPVLRSLRREA